MGEPREDARRWLAERYERARSACYHEGDPCPDCLADAVLDAPGAEVQVQRTLIEQSGFHDHVVIRLPAQPIEGRDG